jgi:hypothetical protein
VAEPERVGATLATVWIMSPRRQPVAETVAV